MYEQLGGTERFHVVVTNRSECLANCDGDPPEFRDTD